MKVLAKYLLIPLFLLVGAVQAGNADSKTTQKIRDALSKHLPSAAQAGVKTTPMKGIYEVAVGGTILYVSEDGRYVINGNMLDLQTRRNLTEETMGEVRKKLVDELGEKNMLVYMPDGKVKHTITVFTDIYCPYCRRLHSEMDEYKKNGVKVRYVFLPFKGKRSYDASVNVWCADNPQEAMNKAKAGEEIPHKTCANPIDKHKALGSDLGIRGTPAIMYENGQMSPGYVPAKKVVQQMEAMGL